MMMSSDNRNGYENFISEAEKKGNLRKKYINKKGVEKDIRNHHLSNIKIEKIRKRYKEFIKDVSKEIKEKAGPVFFNPYRQSGVYFGCVQSLFLLGANEWFAFSKVVESLEQAMTINMIPDKFGRKPWEKFACKSERKNKNGEKAPRAEDLNGRIKHDMRVLQRVSISTEANPYGYKLAQALACIDIRIDVEGQWFLRLNTRWDKVEDVKPLFMIIKKKNEE